MFQQQLSGKSGLYQTTFCVLSLLTLGWIVFGAVRLFPYAQVNEGLAALPKAQTPPTAPAPLVYNAFFLETAVSIPPQLIETTSPTFQSPEILKTYQQRNATLLVEWVQVIDKPTKPEETILNTVVPPAPLEDAQLIIPSLELTHIITKVPVVSGQWDISELGSQVGHLQTTGEAPNQGHAMTFIGHATVPWPGIGPFADLIRVEHGEEIIYRWGGNDYVYEVSRILLVNPSSVESLYESDGEMLILATCSNWDFADREYDKRLVTQAKLVRIIPSPVGDQGLGTRD